MQLEIETMYIRDSILQEIGKKISQERARLNSNRKASKSDTGFVDKALSSTVGVSQNRKTLELLEEVHKAVIGMRVSTKSSLPAEFTKSVTELASNLSYQETVKLQKMVNSMTRSERAKTIKDIEDNKKTALKAVHEKVMGIGGNFIGSHLTIYDNYGKIVKSTSMASGIEELANHCIAELNKQSANDMLYLTSNENNDFEIRDPRFPANLMEMVNRGYIQKNDNNKKIISHFNQIKEAFMAKEKLESKITALNSTIILVQGLSKQNELLKDNNIEYKEVEKYLLELQKKAANELKKITAFIDKFDFTPVLQEVNEAEMKEKEEQERKNKMFEYATLSYEYEKAKASGDPEAAYNAQEKMRLYGQRCGLKDSDMMDAIKMGADKFYSEQQDIEITKEDIRKREEKRKQMLQEQATYLRQAAIAEIEARGGYKGQWEERNGDVYDGDSYEAAVEREVQRLQAEMKKAEAEPEPSIGKSR